jgi:hypothetical protein
MISFALVAALVAATALLVRFFVLDNSFEQGQQPLHSPEAENQSLTSVSRFMPEVLPSEWNDQLIVQQIQSLQQRPPVLSHFIHSVIGRFIIGQNDKTAQKRTQLILSAINQLKATKDLQVAIDDLQIHSLEREIRFTEKEIERNSAQDRLAKQKDLEALRRRKEQLDLEVQIAKLEQEKRGYEQRSAPEKTEAKPWRLERNEEGGDETHRAGDGRSNF